VSESAEEPRPDEEQPEEDQLEEEKPEDERPEEGGEEQVTFDAMLDAIRQAKVAELLLSTMSTLASVAYGKLEAKDTDEAKRAIDAIDALLPLLEGQIDASITRDFSQALTNLKLAYASAVTSAQ
jgi:hypothetical protein